MILIACLSKIVAEHEYNEYYPFELEKQSGKILHAGQDYIDENK